MIFSFKKIKFINSSLFWLFFLFLCSLFFHFNAFGQPNQVVFDEVHFGKFSSAYFTGKYFFDIHPPLGKLIIAGGAYLGGYADFLSQHPPFDFQDIGENFADLPFWGFRFFPTLAGTLFPLIIFWLVSLLGAKKSTAVFAALFCLLETSLLTQSRFILLDSFLLLFGFLGLCFFLLSQKKDSLFLSLLAGIFLGASLSIKWTGLSFLGLAGIFWLIDWLENNEKALILFFQKKNFPYSIHFFVKKKAARRKILRPFLSLFLIFSAAFAIYSASFAIHFHLLPLSGEGDAFMDENFRQEGFWEKFFQLNQKINFYNSNLKDAHPDSSHFWQWPILKEPVHYWNNGDARIIFFGNPILWLGGFLSITLFILFWKKIPLSSKSKFFLLVGFWSNLLPFLSVRRSLFLYHYLSALVFSLIMWSIIFNELLNEKKPWVKIFQITFLILVSISFFLFSFLSYGWSPLGDWHQKLLDFFLYY